MTPPLDRLDVVDDQTASILRAKSGAERLAIAHGMWRSAGRLLRSILQAEHPDWTQDQIQREVARRLSHGAV